MATKEVHSDAIKIEQKPAIALDGSVRQPDIVRADTPVNTAYLDSLAFNEEPVTIRLEPSTERNAPKEYPVWVNGDGAEIFTNGKWRRLTYLPVGKVITVKRKVAEVLLHAKVDTVQTEVVGEHTEHPSNHAYRNTSAVHSIAIIEDKNPRGQAWLAERRRRNF